MRRLDIRSQLPASTAGRVAVLALLAIGGLIAVGLTALIAVYFVSSLRGR